MGHVLKKMKNGNYGIYSTVVNGFILEESTLNRLRKAYKSYLLNQFFKDFSQDWKKRVEYLNDE